MNKILFILLACMVVSCSTSKNISPDKINATIDAWHQAAAQADFKTYFSLMTADAVFIGTDATENWNKKEFMAYSKPHFDKGKAWSFTSIERHIYQSNGVVYFDELLKTQMGLCRGSGVLKPVDGNYKIAHYVLSIAIPNEDVPEVTAAKKSWETEFLKNFK
ncbi:MAG: nuclear transport factor 2 family protein [Nonlabens sp.]